MKPADLSMHRTAGSLLRLQRAWRVLAALLIASTLHAAEWKFDFSTGEPQPGHIRVAPKDWYDAKRGYGFLRQQGDNAENVPVFAVDIAEGNYDVTMKFGAATRATSTTIKAEQRRLMIEKVETKPKEFVARTFTVNARTPAINSGGTTTLKARELGPSLAPNWDDQLTFEFNGKSPGVATLRIKPAKDALTVFLAGDSTVTDAPREPWAGWGQMLPRFFQKGVAVSNHAESGLALFSFEKQKRLAKILSVMKPGDYLFIQFGHNDQKNKAAGAGAFTTYASDLKRFIDAAKSKGGIPVVVTSMERRRWEGDQQQTTLDDYAKAAREVAEREKVPVIDLHAMSLKLYAALGPERSKLLFAHYPANTFPGQNQPLKDDTHHNGYGGYELARCVVEGIRSKLPELAARLADDAGAFDPAKPDAPENVSLPASPITGPLEKPAGN